eukprot:scaffold6195_cov60-Cylindrotheca_fusiformis.AAC.2
MASSQTEDNMLESSENSFMFDDQSDSNNSQSSDEEIPSVEGRRPNIARRGNTNSRLRFLKQQTQER